MLQAQAAEIIGRPILDDREKPGRKPFKIELFPMAMKFQ
jgi:hypothetical protein